MAKAASGVPVLWESFFRVLWIQFFVCDWDHAYASFWADPGAYSAASAFVHVELVSASVALGEEYFLVRVLHGEGSLEDVFDSFIHCA
jgi:hypothetical protein